MQHVNGDSKSHFNPHQSTRVCVFIKLYSFGLVFIAVDYPLLHMCLYVVVDQIMLLPSNQMECIIVYY